MGKLKNREIEREEQAIPELRELMKGVYGTAKGIVTKGEEVFPAFFGTTVKGDTGIYMTAWKNDEEKRIILSNIRLAFALHRVIQYVFISEAWVVCRRGQAMNDMTPPSECPDREEKLMLMGVSYDKTYHAYADLGQTKDGERTIGELQWFDGANPEGRMMNLLPPKDLPELPEEVTKGLCDYLGLAMQPFDVPTVH